MVADTLTAYGGLDLLHNNAAAIKLNLTDQDVVTMPLDTWHTAMRVNLDGVMLGCRFAIPAMLERGGGAIVNTASVAASYGSRSLAAYGTSKAGVVALTRYVATAYADRKIRVNGVAPGVVVDRDLQEALGGPLGDTLAPITAGHLVGRPGNPRRLPRPSPTCCPTTPRSSPARRSPSTADTPRTAEPEPRPQLNCGPLDDGGTCTQLWRLRLAEVPTMPAEVQLTG